MRGILPIGQSGFHGEAEKVHALGSCEVCNADFPVTGSGKAYSSCGSFFTVGCLNVEEHKGMNLLGQNMEGKAFLQRIMNSCDRPLCPVCWEKWASREVKNAVHRLGQYILKGHVLKAIHVIVSVCKVDYELSLEEMRKKVYKALKRVHCLGGMMIYHPRRWDFAGSYYSPHFHIIGYGWIADVRSNFMNTGYIIRNVGIRKTLEGTIWYQLSHCGISEKYHAISWFGALGYTKLKVKPLKKEVELCPICGNRLRKLLWCGEGKDPMPNVEGVPFFDDSDNWVDVERFKYE